MALEVIFVGVSGASLGGGEETACYVVNRHILVDTGWNAAVSMQSHDLVPTDIDHVFITHCHQDHTLGLPGLFFANRNRAQARPDAPTLQLYGTRDLPAIRDAACAMLQADRDPQCVPEHEVRRVYPGESLELGDLKVDVGRAFHTLDARCYRITDTATGGSVAFSGDSAYHEGLLSFVREVDVLIHEAAAGVDSEVADLQRYLHSRPQDAARVAKEAGVTSLVLVHYQQSAGPEILRRAKEIFPSTRLAKKGQRLQVLGPGQAMWL